MARGPRKSVDDKIREKEELIESLKVRMQAENRELEQLKQEKRVREMESIAVLIEDSGISVEEARSILEQHLIGSEESCA